MKKKYFLIKFRSFAIIFIVFNLFFVQTNLNAQGFVSSGRFHCLFLSYIDSIPKACGANDTGQLGDGTETQRFSPIQTNGLNGIVSISAGALHSLFLKYDGTVWVCGWNIYGQLGDGTTNNMLNTNKISGLSNIVSISAGEYQSLFLKNDGSVWACGGNSFGQLGDGTIIDKGAPIQIVGSSFGAIAIATGTQHSLILKNDGTVWAFGDNQFGQLGDGTTIQRLTPVQVSSLTGIIAIAGGGQHSLFLKNDGTVWACGNNQFGQLGNVSATSTPVKVNGLTNVIKIAAGYYHSLFLKNDGGVWGCGNNGSGQLGDGTTNGRSIPDKIVGLTGITSIAAGEGNSLFSKNDGTFWACGDNWQGQLGDVITLNKYIPFQIVFRNNKSDLPIFSHPTGTYDNSLSVTLSSTSENATIIYTTDGSLPSENNGTIYSSVINIKSTTTLKAIEYDTRLNASDVSSQTYTIINTSHNDSIHVTDNYFPATVSGTLAFEDQWPSKGDYDMNDVIVDYQFHNVIDSNNKLVETFANFTLRATGASYHSGFGFQLSTNNIPASAMQVTGSAIHENYLMINANGTEQNQNKPTIIVFDNAFDVLHYPGSGIGINTTPGATYIIPVTITLHITYTQNTYREDQLDIAHFNPFIIVSMNRGKEVHLPDYPPTLLADIALLGTFEDNSIPSQGKYYKTKNNLPWALNTYSSFSYPIEKAEITKAYLHFIDWVISNGSSYTDWYSNTAPGYRNNNNIYTPTTNY